MERIPVILDENPECQMSQLQNDPTSGLVMCKTEHYLVLKPLKVSFSSCNQKLSKCNANPEMHCFVVAIAVVCSTMPDPL